MDVLYSSIGLLEKLKRLGKSEGWVHDAILALDKSDFLKLAVFTATDDSAVPLVDKLLEGTDCRSSGHGSAGGGSLTKRAHDASKYVGHLGASEAVTIFQGHWLVTYAHGHHCNWAIGDTVDVWVNNVNGEQRRQIAAVVMYKSLFPVAALVAAEEIHGPDYILLRTDAELVAPSCDNTSNAGDLFVLGGCSARSQKGDPSSVRHGAVCSTLLDANGHMKADFPSALGDSGGGCFLAATGKLFAINVANDINSNDASLLPISVPIAMASNLDGERVGRKASGD